MTDTIVEFGDGESFAMPSDFSGADSQGRGGYSFVENWTRLWTSAAGALRFARGLGALSTTALTPGTGSKAFGLTPPTALFPEGSIVQAKSLGAPDHYMVGHVASLAAGTLTVTVTAAAGGTSRSDWVIGNLIAVGDVPRWSVVTGAMTAAHGQYLAPDTSGGAFTITLPAAPAQGDTVRFADIAQSWAAENLTVDGNGNSIVAGGYTGDRLICTESGTAFGLAFDGAKWGYLYG